jgi:L-arabinose isomerase
MMDKTTRIGLLPLYLKLYDDRMPERRSMFEPFLATVKKGFESRGIAVELAPVCRVASEFSRAVRMFEAADVDCIVTLHLAYSPSLESVPALTACKLPVVILDTTMDSAFGRDVNPGKIMNNHGIHGVMDLASMLRRKGKAFVIAAGHVVESKVMDRVSNLARAARAARAFRGMKTLCIGESFRGMGDFAVQPDILRGALGITTRRVGLDAVEKAAHAVSSRAVREEMEADRRRFGGKVAPDTHERSARLGLGIRRILDDGGYGAFSMNFLAFDRAEGAAGTVPFLEASKAMARGIGYAGEGDVLTASLVGALQQGFGRTTFTEIFCPDWRGDTLFLSHMGEINPEVAAGKPVMSEYEYRFGAARNPVVVTCAPKPGSAVFVNIAPGPGNTFGLIVAPVRVLGDSTRSDMRKSVRGWIRPACGIERFLEEYSRHGGTHHSALVLGDRHEAIEAFAVFSGIESATI